MTHTKNETMTHTYKVTGMSCSRCQAKVKQLLSAVPDVKNISIDLQKAEATIEMENHVPTTRLQSALKDYPKYQLHEKNSDNGHTRHREVKADNLNPVGEQGEGKYYCPMHCEGDKTYDKPGSCPVCGMH